MRLHAVRVSSQLLFMPRSRSIRNKLVLLAVPVGLLVLLLRVRLRRHGGRSRCNRVRLHDRFQKDR
jgi:hypothetical protein